MNLADPTARLPRIRKVRGVQSTTSPVDGTPREKRTRPNPSARLGRGSGGHRTEELIPNGDRTRPSRAAHWTYTEPRPEPKRADDAS